MNNNQLLSNYYSMHRGELISFIAVRIHDVYEAEDMVQDIFLRLLRDKHTAFLSPLTSDLSPLIYTMALHAVSDYYRRAHVYEEYEHFIKTSDIRPQTSDIRRRHRIHLLCPTNHGTYGALIGAPAQSLLRDIPLAYLRRYEGQRHCQRAFTSLQTS